MEQRNRSEQLSSNSFYEDPDEELYDDIEENEESDISQLSLKELFFVIPTGLQSTVAKQVITAIVVLFLSIALIIVYKTPQCLIGVIVAAWLLWNALSILLDFQAGQINEDALLCCSVQGGLKIQSRTRVVFRTQDEFPSYYEFFIPGRKATMFVENHVYLLYTRVQEPKRLIGWQGL